MSLSTGIDLSETFRGRVLKDIKFQPEAVRYLENAIRNKRLASTYLFAGPEGAGKEETAIAFAKALTCPARQRCGDFCDQCSSCRRMASRNHPDLTIVKPEGKASLITVDAIRFLQQRMALKPYEAKMKIGLVRDADNMKEEAANALLKLLEEPPAQAILILTVQGAGQLLPTIVSRCQKVRFSPLKRETLERLLSEDYGMEAARGKVLSRLSEGSLRAALEFDAADRRDNAQWFFKGGRPIHEFLTNASREEIDKVLKMLITFYRDILTLKWGGDKDILMNVDYETELIDVSVKWGQEYIEKMLTALFRAKALIMQMVNPKLALLELELTGEKL